MFKAIWEFMYYLIGGFDSDMIYDDELYSEEDWS